jgi:hypothetical protein
LGIDVVAELERVRSNLLAIALIVEDLRVKHNAHTHGGTVPAPPAGEQAVVGYVAH